MGWELIQNAKNSTGPKVDEAFLRLNVAGGVLYPNRKATDMLTSPFVEILIDKERRFVGLRQVAESGLNARRVYKHKGQATTIGHRGAIAMLLAAGADPKARMMLVPEESGPELLVFKY